MVENVTRCRNGGQLAAKRLNCHYPSGIDSLMLRTV